jgi:hypothetical protein
MIPDRYDEKVQQCVKMMRSCTNTRAVKALQRLAEDYRTIAAARRREDTEELETDDDKSPGRTGDRGSA